MRMTAFGSVLVISASIGGVTAKSARAKPLPEQWYTGSLFSPSPALPQKGMLAIETYATGSVPIGAYESTGRLNTKAGGQKVITQYTLIKYAITDRLSFYSLPTFTYGWGNKAGNTGVKFNDLPIELHYRVINENTDRHYPSLTGYLGFSAPTGDYSHLLDPSEGVGQGVWFLRFGVQSQVTVPLGGHPLRIRLWAQARQPMNSAHLQGISSYGTQKGFSGRGHAGVLGNDGVSLEYGLTKKWVFALDLYNTWAAGSLVRGAYGQRGIRVDHRAGWSTLYNLGPAMEYNWSPSMGVILGAVFSVSGHNSARQLSPQFAFNMLF